MPAKPTHVEAYSTKTGQKQTIPAKWLEPTSPFSSDFKLTPRSRAAVPTPAEVQEKTKEA